MLLGHVVDSLDPHRVDGALLPSVAIVCQNAGSNATDGDVPRLALPNAAAVLAAAQALPGDGDGLDPVVGGDLFHRVTLYPKPTVAALNGHTFAAGVFLAAHMDFRLMREDRGWVCLPEVDINTPLLPGMIAICQAIMPPQGFRQLYYTGKRFTAPEAQALGFVDQLCAEADLLPEATALAALLAKKRVRTYAEMKRRIRVDVARLLVEEEPKHFSSTLGFALG